MRPRLFLLASAVLFSTAGAAIKACGLGAGQVIGFRSILAVFVLLACLPETRTGWRRSTLVVGAVYALQMALFVSATKLTSAANAIFLQSTAPLYLLVLGPLWLREPVRRSDVAVMLAVAVGLAIILHGDVAPSDIARDPRRGNALAAMAGVTWAVTVASMRWLARDGGGAGASMVAGNLLAFLACLPLAFPVVGASARDWAILAFLGTAQVGLAYVCLSIGIRGVPAFEASLLMLIEPVLNPVWTWLVHGERVGPAALAGGAIVLAAAAAKTVLDAPAGVARGRA